MFETLRRYKEAICLGIVSAATGGSILFEYLAGNRSGDLLFFAMVPVFAAVGAVGSVKDTYSPSMMSYLIESFSGVSEDLPRRTGVQSDVNHPYIQDDEFKFSAHP